MKKTFYLIRHGQTDWNLQKRLQGSNDIPLNDTGRTQAQALRPVFQTLPVDLLFASPMGRAQETLRIIFPDRASEVRIEADLREVHLGPLEGRPQVEVETEFGMDQWLKWMEIPDGSEDFAFPGAETPRQSNTRLANCLVKIAKENHFETAALCLHGFLLRRFIQFVSPVQPSRIIPNGLIAEIECDTEKAQFKLVQIISALEEKRF